MKSFRPLVASAVSDHEMVPCRQDRVEQELAILATGIAITHARRPGEQIVAVGRRETRELAVVEPEQTDDSVRHGTHRDEGADCEVPGAEVGSGGSTLESS